MNSISGGRTSAYMAAHLPADINVFAAVCMDNPLAKIKDAGLLSACRKKLERYDDRFGEFIGSAEDSKTFRVVLDLEQMIGKEIIWVRGESFEAMVNRKKSLPNQEWRFCTTFLKISPIAEFIFETIGEKVINRQGIRIDEAQRIKAEGHRTQAIDIQIGNYANGNRKWLNFEFAEAAYPLVFDDEGKLDPIKKAEIYQWANGSGLDFPKSSNCQFCFHKSVAELIGNNAENPKIFQAAREMEELRPKGSMKKDYPISKIQRLQVPPIQLSFFGGDSCESGFCHD